MIEKRVSRAILLNHDHQVLLGRRARGIGSGMFALIGGKPDGNESALEAIKRETYEEIVITPEFTFWKEQISEAFEPGVVWITSYFFANLIGKIIPKLDEISETIFVGEDQLEMISIAFDHKQRLLEFFAFYKNLHL